MLCLPCSILMGATRVAIRSTFVLIIYKYYQIKIPFEPQHIRYCEVPGCDIRFIRSRKLGILWTKVRSSQEWHKNEHSQAMIRTCCHISMVKLKKNGGLFMTWMVVCLWLERKINNDVIDKSTRMPQMKLRGTKTNRFRAVIDLLTVRLSIYWKLSAIEPGCD